MFRTKLKNKLMASAFSMVLFVSLAIIFVVSIIINRQNRIAVKRNLKNGASIVKFELEENQKKLSRDIHQIIIANKLGATVKFLNEFADDELAMTHNTFIKLAEILLNTANEGGLVSLGIYDTKGDLMAFALRENNKTINYGFFKKPEFHFATVVKGMEASGDEWKTAETINAGKLKLKYGGEISSSGAARFEPVGNGLGFMVSVPVFANKIDDDTGKSKSVLFGMAIAVKKLDKGIIEKINRFAQVDVNFFTGEKFTMGELPEYDHIDPKAFRPDYNKNWNIESQKLFFSELKLKENRYFQAVLPIFGGKDFVGAAAVFQSDEIVKTNNSQMVKMLILVSLACVIVCVPLILILSGRIVRPLSQMVLRLKDIAEGEGDLTKRLAIKSPDEVGRLAEWFNIFINNIHQMIKNVKDNSNRLREASVRLSEIAGFMDQGAEKTSAKANGVARSSDKMSANMSSVAAAMEEASTNIEMVAAATEEISTSINEITQNTAKARDVTAQAVEQTGSASSQVLELGNAAKEIEGVVETITDVSDQVNLLALNATIEAARAGDAGKGFAVVANEIKELARQTAQATSQIKQKVQGISKSTEGTVGEIENISQVVKQVNEIVFTIAGAVEEQSVTTHQIAENVSQASTGIGEVNKNVAGSSSFASEIAGEIDEITSASGVMSENSSQVNQSSAELSGFAEKLDQLVRQFKV